MKQLGKGKGRRVHPAPQAPRDHLAALPVALLALAAALTAEEQEVLAYLLSGGGGGGSLSWREQWRLRAQHPPELGCRCFGCYKSFWARWDASPNRHVIHMIIDAVEESLEARELDRGGGARRRRRSVRGRRKGAGLAAEATAIVAVGQEERFGVEEKGFLGLDGGHLADDDGDRYEEEEDDDDDDDGDVGDDGDDVGEEMNGGESTNTNGDKSSVRRFMSFIGERVWGVWN